MTAPITGPYTKSEELKDIPHWSTGATNNRRWVLKRSWYRQAKPYDLPLTFDFVTKNASSRYTSTGPYGNFSGSSVDASAILPDTVAMDQNIYNKAYAKFVDAMGAAVEGGIATAEGRQAMSMISTRLLQMANFTRHVARGQLGKAAKDLGVDWNQRPMPKRAGRRPNRHTRSPSKDRRETARSFSSIYLEFHFGWSPLMKDIYDAMEVLDNPIEPHRISETAGGSWKDPLGYATKTTVSSTHTTTETRDGRYTQFVKLQGDLIITNPNLAMMQQNGILNPVSIAWELVPFSFVLDWFVNVGDYLGSLTDFAGVEFLNAHRTIFTRYNTRYDKLSAPKTASYNKVVEVWNCDAVNCYRRTGLGTGPSIRLRTPKPWGIRRGLAAASLLMQSFPSQVIDRNAAQLAKKRTAFRANVFPSFNGKYF